MKNEHMDTLLKKAMRCSDTPGMELVERVKNQFIEEEPIVKKTRYSFSTAAIAIALVLILATAAFAAYKLLGPGEVAGTFDDQALSAAFDSESAVNINASVTSGGYVFTLLGVATGKDITDTPYYSEDVLDERTYAVVAIQNADGTPMPDMQDDIYRQLSFFATPLVKGQNPARVNAMTMNGGYSEDVVDGVLYRIVECDGVAMFADRGLYFAVCTGSFYDAGAFLYDEQTGEVKADPDFEGASAVFDLPLDASLADPEKAEQYLDDLNAPPDESGDTPGIAKPWESVDWDNAVPVESTVKEITAGEDGLIRYTWDTGEYGGGTSVARYEDCFTDDQTVQSKIIDQMASGNGDTLTVYAVRFTKAEDGTITGMIVVPE